MSRIKTVTVEAQQINGYKIETKAGNHTLFIDQPAAAGGSDTGPTPLEYLFLSLAGCIITTGYVIAKQRSLPVRSISVKVDGDLDLDYFIGKTKEGRAGFTSIRVHTVIDADMTIQEKEQFLREIDSRCPISDNLAHVSSLEFSVE